MINRIRAFKSLASLFVGLALAIPTVTMASFSTADLAGTWHIFTFFDSTTSNDPGWSRGTVTLNSSGTVTSGTLQDNEGVSSTVTAGSLSIDSNGVMIGSITAGGVTSTISRGKMDLGKTIAAFVSTDDQGFVSPITAIKAGGTFSTADLAGTWHVFSFFDDTDSNSPGWTYGTVTVGSGGAFTGGSLLDSDGTSSTVTGGSLSMDSSGLFTGTLITNDGTFLIPQGKMDIGKTTAAFVDVEDQGSSVSKVTAIKAGGTFSTADLAGTWHIFSQWDSIAENDPGWTFGTFTIDSSGILTGGNAFDSNGSSATVTGGSFTLDSSGVFSGTSEMSDGTFLLQGKMDMGKTVMSFVDKNAPSLVTAIKAETPSSNRQPVCNTARAFPDVLWSPNHQMVSVSIIGVTDPDGDAILVTATSITQDEAVREPGVGSGNTAPDATLSPLAVRAERDGKPTGNGRVYHINFTADDGRGGQCIGVVKVCVPHDQSNGGTCVDGGPLYSSLAL